jgi:hypothetical protein
MAPRPATGKTPRHSIRVDDTLWQAAKSKAAKEGKSISEVVRECLVAYAAKDESGA